MKRRGERRRGWGEGWLIAAALGLMLAFSLAVYAAERPGAQEIAPLHAVPAAQLRRLEMVDLNGATAEELAGLPGIGETLAQRIVNYRNAHGPFSSPEDLTNVQGVGKGKIARIRDLVYVE